jgi:hypothetical protein
MTKDKFLDGVAVTIISILVLAFLVLIVWAIIVSGGWFLVFIIGVALFMWSLMRVTKKW